MPVTRDDVWFCLHLYEQRREPVLREAREWMSNFHPRSFQDLQKVMSGKAGPDANRFWRQAMSYWEMIASLLTSGAISGEAVDLFAKTTREWLFFWSKVEPFITEVRAATRATAYANLELLCRSRPDYEEVMAYFRKVNAQMSKGGRAKSRPTAAKSSAKASRKPRGKSRNTR